MRTEASRRAARQHGLITVAQLAEAGMSRRQMKYAVETGSLIGMRRGVYRVAGLPTTWEQAVLASVLVAGNGAATSHATAAALWALKHSDRHRAGLHVTVARQARLTGVITHIRRLPRTSLTSLHGIPVTTPEQTIVDIAGVMRPAQLGGCLDDAERRHLVDLRKLPQHLELGAGGESRRGRAALRGLLADALPGGPAASEWEREMDLLWQKLGLPPAIRHYRVVAGGHHYEIDRAIPELKIGVEWNGYAYHGTRSAFHYDSDRRADLTAEGWHMIDFTYRSSPGRIVRAVVRAVHERSRSGPPWGW